METFRRQLIDSYLDSSSHILSGDVIDIGGKKANKRGKFNPQLPQVTSWKYVNLDKSTNPDYFCNAENIPVEQSSFDTALLCETLEHLENPEKVLREAHRILKNAGILVITVPFLFPFHADPQDFQRWTATKIKSVLSSIGFSNIEMVTMGGTGMVIHDLLLISANRMSNRYFSNTIIRLLKISRPLYLFMDKMFRQSRNFVTTGYFVIAKK